MKTTRPRRLPGEEGVWMFVAGDMVVFALFFTTFLYYRGLDRIGFERSQRLLDVDLGVLNTLLLLLSSWLVVLALAALRAGSTRRTRRLLLGAAACGAGFVVIKIFEYHAKLTVGITLVTDQFFSFYFMFTGIHLVHVLLGIGVLLLLSARTRTATADDIRLFENGATFWHMVDLLWIVLFPTLYLIAG